MLKLAFRIAIMMSALTACIIAMVYLRSNTGPKIFETMGFKPVSKNYLSWCQERVTEISTTGKDKVQINETKGKWLVSKDINHKEINYLKMEKWLAEYCQVKIVHVEKQDFFKQKLESLFRVKLKNEDKFTFFKVGEDKFQVRSLIFQSEELEKGFNELSVILGKKPK